MIKLLLLFLIPASIYGSKILSYNVYDRSDRVDVMITFDTPYDGVIKQSKTQSKIVIKLQGAKIESAKIKKLSTKFLKSISITPMSDHTQIVASIPSSVRFIASKTSDSYGLRLRFTNKAIKKQTTKQAVGSSSGLNGLLSTLPTKQEDDMSQSYYMVIAILVLGIVILFFLKRKITYDNSKKVSNGWLFKEENAKTPIATKDVNDANFDSNVSIRFQKAINDDNSVVKLDFGQASYLVLMGNGNILLDKFTDDKPTTQEDFNSILKSRHQELDDFLKVENNEAKEPLQAYKEKAASIIYAQDA